MPGSLPGQIGQAVPRSCIQLAILVPHQALHLQAGTAPPRLAVRLGVARRVILRAPAAQAVTAVHVFLGRTNALAVLMSAAAASRCAPCNTLGYAHSP